MENFLNKPRQILPALPVPQIGLFAFLIFFVFHTPIYAKPAPIALESEDDFYEPLRPHVHYFIDQSASLTIEDIQQSDIVFAPVETKYIDFGLSDGRIWLKFLLSNDTAERDQWRIDLARQYMQELDIYMVREGDSPKLVMHHTDQDAFHERSVASRYLAVDIEIAPLETVQFYVGYRSSITTFLPIAIASLDASANERANEDTVNWILNGALLAMFLLAILMTPIIGWRISLAFCLYIWGGSLYVFHADGYTFQYFFPNRPALNDTLNLSFMLLMPIFGLSFARVLFDTKKVFPKFDKVLLTIVITAAIFALLAVPMIKNNLFMVVGYWIVPIGAAAQMITGVLVLRRGLVGATPYLVGACFVLASFIYAVAAHLVPGSFNLDRTLDFGHLVLLIDSLAFACAIVLRMLAVRRERDEALQAELSATQKQLGLANELRKSQDDYHHARKIADLRRAQLSSVSHDLQQPLASLRIALDRIGGENEQMTEQMRAAFDYLESLALTEIRKAQEDTNDDHSRIVETFPVRAVLDNVKEMFRDEATKKGLSLRYKPSRANVSTDAVALMRAISNLVSNAIKHTDKGGVLLACRQRDERLRIEIWDTGPGMTEDEIIKLKERHQKGKKSSGSGLGLSIVSEISNDLDYDFEINSKPGKGTLAVLNLPIVS